MHLGLDAQCVCDGPLGKCWRKNHPYAYAYSTIFGPPLLFCVGFLIACLTLSMTLALLFHSMLSRRRRPNGSWVAACTLR
jgi:hypothetical protein